MTGFRPFFNPATGEWIEYTALAEDSNGALVRFNWRSMPGGVITEHIHPHQEERFTIKAGEAHFTLNGQELVARAGETIVVPAGAPHSEGNADRSTSRGWSSYVRPCGPRSSMKPWRGWSTTAGPRRGAHPRTPSSSGPPSGTSDTRAGRRRHRFGHRISSSHRCPCWRRSFESGPTTSAGTVEPAEPPGALASTRRARRRSEHGEPSTRLALVAANLVRLHYLTLLLASKVNVPGSA